MSANKLTQSEERKIKALYALDLGNGFTKRIFYKGQVIIEPSFLAKVPNSSYNNSKHIKFSVNKESYYYLGEDVTNAKLKPIPALGSDDKRRYFTDEYKTMVFSFIARDFINFTHVDIPVLIMGVPNTDHAAVKAEMEKFYKGTTTVTLNEGESEVVITVQNCVVLPQPLGTYAYAVEKGIIESWGDNALICDAGAGTFDVAAVIADMVKRDEGLEIGSLDAYIEIRKLLLTHFGNDSGITLEAMPEIMEKGVLVDNERVRIDSIRDLNEKVQLKLDENFKEMYDFLNRMKFKLNEYTKIVWTGGTSIIHKDRIEGKGRNNFVVMEDAQVANVLGFFEIAMSIAAALNINVDELFAQIAQLLEVGDTVEEVSNVHSTN